MKTLLTIAAVSLLSLLKITVWPNLNLCLWVLIVMAIDLVTGVIKACMLKQARTSSGFRKTLVKFTQYGGALLISIVLTNVSGGFPKASGFVSFIGDGMLVYMIYIELVSICENLYAVDQESPFSRYVIKPLLSVLTFQLKNNPSLKALEEQKKDITPAVLILAGVLCFAGCKAPEYTETEAKMDIVKAHAYFPGVTGGFCHDVYPCRDSISREVIFTPGEKILVPGPVIEVPCDGETDTVRIQCPDTYTQHDTIRDNSYVQQTDKGELKALQAEYNKLNSKTLQLEKENAVLQNERDSAVKIKNRLIAIIVIALLLVGIYLWLKTKLKWLQ